VGDCERNAPSPCQILDLSPLLENKLAMSRKHFPQAVRYPLDCTNKIGGFLVTPILTVLLENPRRGGEIMHGLTVPHALHQAMATSCWWL
jgi:hypothetical protein